jgi:Ca-activated chloride channel family protein
MKMKYLSAIAIGSLLFSACGKDPVVVQPQNNTQQFELFIDYWNPSGTNPQITFDAVNSSPEVKIDFTKNFTGIAVPPQFTNVIIDNVRIINEQNTNFEISEIKAYEWREDINDWKNDVEFVMNYEQVQDLNVMMVLDASSSLGSDFENIKDFSNDFVTKVLNDNPTAKIGVVSFSDVINSMPLTSDYTTISNYIDGIQQGPFTSLYEAMNIGVDSLLSHNAESRAILTFTDGTDNNSNPSYTPAYLKNKLENNPNGILINSFTIGLEGNGGVDRAILEGLAINGGVAEFPSSINGLRSVFEKFSSSISNVYNFTYVRNQQPISGNAPVKLKFVIKATPK